MIGAEAARLSNQARFILEKCDGTVKIENKKKQVMIDELARRGYDSDPVKTWKKTQVMKCGINGLIKICRKIFGLISSVFKSINVQCSN